LKNNLLDTTSIIQCDRMTYKASGLRNLPYVAMSAQKAGHNPIRFIDVDREAHHFFIIHGLPTIVAKAFVNLAITIRDGRG
jgi:hypothetical protein